MHFTFHFPFLETTNRSVRVLRSSEGASCSLMFPFFAAMNIWFSAPSPEGSIQMKAKITALTTNSRSSSDDGGGSRRRGRLWGCRGAPLHPKDNDVWLMFGNICWFPSQLTPTDGGTKESKIGKETSWPRRVFMMKNKPTGTEQLSLGGPDLGQA